jgi:hypothetical protein
MIGLDGGACVVIAVPRYPITDFWDLISVGSDFESSNTQPPAA